MRGLSNKHWQIMLACCLVPLGLLVAVTVFGVSLGNLGFFAMILLCPLMHVFMMRGMHHGDHGAKQETTTAVTAAADSGDQPVAVGRRGSCH